MASQDDMLTVFQESALQTRTPELYNQQVRDLASGKTTVSDCAVTRPSALAVLPYYHPVCNDSVELTHDLAEGVLPLKTKLFLCHLLFDVKCMSVTDLNNRIKSADNVADLSQVCCKNLI